MWNSVDIPKVVETFWEYEFKELPAFVQGKLTAHGKLLQQETFCVWEQDGGVLSRSKERRVFLFEQIVIFSELLRKGSSNPGYQFKSSIKVMLIHTSSTGDLEWHTRCWQSQCCCSDQVTYLAMQDSVDGDPCKFVLWSRGSAERFTLQASSASIKISWVETISALLDAQNNFLSGEYSSLKVRLKISKIFFTSSKLSICEPPSGNSERPHSSLAPYSHIHPRNNDSFKRLLKI